MKRCPKCKQVKPLSEFCKNRNSPDGYAIHCRVCKNHFTNQWRKKHPEKTTAWLKKWIEQNPHKRAEIQRRYGQNHKEEIAARYKEYRIRKRDVLKNSRLLRVYGISLKEYDALFMEQGGKCAICGLSQDVCRKPFVVDHSHTSGIVRSLLCTDCNLTLGKVKENVIILRAMIDYIEKNTVHADLNAARNIGLKGRERLMKLVGKAPLKTSGRRS